MNRCRLLLFFNINSSADDTRKQRVKTIVWFVMSQTGGNIRLQYHSSKGDQSFIKHNYFCSICCRLSKLKSSCVCDFE